MKKNLLSIDTKIIILGTVAWICGVLLFLSGPPYTFLVLGLCTCWMIKVELQKECDRLRIIKKIEEELPVWMKDFDHSENKKISIELFAERVTSILKVDKEY